MKNTNVWNIFYQRLNMPLDLPLQTTQELSKLQTTQPQFPFKPNFISIEKESILMTHGLVKFIPKTFGDFTGEFG